VTEPMFETIQTMPNALETYVWIGEKPRFVWHSPGRVSKYRNNPATIESGNLQRATAQDAREMAAVLEMCAKTAEALDANFPMGIPDITEFLKQPE
jgi:hypothetical protein